MVAVTYITAILQESIFVAQDRISKDNPVYMDLKVLYLNFESSKELL